MTDTWMAAGLKLRRDGWPVDGDVVDPTDVHPYCTVCRTFFCPHAKPGLYGTQPVLPPEPPDSPWRIHLTRGQVSEATREGERRQSKSFGKPDTAFDPGPERSLLQHIRACKGEKGVSVMLDLPWTGKGQRGIKRADVGDFYEVRSIDGFGFDRGLIVRTKDAGKVARPFILTVVREDEVTASGWAWVEEIMRDRYKQPPNRYDGKPWWASTDLNDMDVLPVPRRQR